YTVEIEEVIKKRRRILAGGLISVYVPGFMISEAPQIMKGEKYLFFLSPVEVDDERFAGTMIQKPFAPRSEMARFRPDLSYDLVWSTAVHISPDNVGVIDEVKASLRK